MNKKRSARFTPRLRCLHHPHSGEKPQSPRPPCVQSAPRGSKVKRVFRVCISGWIAPAGRRGRGAAGKKSRVVVVFYAMPLQLKPPHTPTHPPTLALKGLTSLCGSRSLSCTDLINNFYQPLAQEISRGWAVEGWWGCVLAGRGVGV